MNGPRLPRKLFIGICAAGLTVALFQGWLASNLFSDYALAHWAAISTSTETPASVDLRFESVEFDGSLPAWYIPGRPANPVLVMVGGYGGNRVSNLDRAVPLHRLGYGLLYIDLAYQLGRATFGGGEREAAEVTAAARWVAARTRDQVVLYGTSAGGLSVLLAGAEGLRPLAIVSDSGLVSERNEVAYNSRLPEWLLGPFALLYPLFSDGGHILDVGTELQQHPGYHVPTLIIQGTADTGIDWHNGKDLARLTHGTLWLLPGVGHVRAFRSDPVRYISVVNAFIRKAQARVSGKP